MAIEYLTGLNAIVMKAIWNIEKRQGRVTIQDLVEEIIQGKNIIGIVFRLI